MWKEYLLTKSPQKANERDYSNETPERSPKLPLIGAANTQTRSPDFSREMQLTKANLRTVQREKKKIKLAPVPGNRDSNKALLTPY